MGEAWGKGTINKRKTQLFLGLTSFVGEGSGKGFILWDASSFYVGQRGTDHFTGVDQKIQD